MKSILQEESSVTKAVERAWDISGKPYEFTVKVLSNEVKNFFGMLKSPAIISFTYNPKFRTDKEKEQKAVKKAAPKKNKPVFNKKDDSYKKDKRDFVPFRKDQEIWKKEFVDDVEYWTKDILRIMGFKVGFNIVVENKMLNIYLDKQVLRDAEDEKMFFISLSGILMQFLKRKHKKRFSNSYLIIHSKKIKHDKGR